MEKNWRTWLQMLDYLLGKPSGSEEVMQASSANSNRSALLSKDQKNLVDKFRKNRCSVRCQVYTSALEDYNNEEKLDKNRFKEAAKKKIKNGGLNPREHHCHDITQGSASTPKSPHSGKYGAFYYLLENIAWYVSICTDCNHRRCEFHMRWRDTLRQVNELRRARSFDLARQKYCVEQEFLDLTTNQRGRPSIASKDEHRIKLTICYMKLLIHTQLLQIDKSDSDYPYPFRVPVQQQLQVLLDCIHATTETCSARAEAWNALGLYYRELYELGKCKRVQCGDRDLQAWLEAAFTFFKNAEEENRKLPGNGRVWAQKRNICLLEYDQNRLDECLRLLAEGEALVKHDPTELGECYLRRGMVLEKRDGAGADTAVGFYEGAFALYERTNNHVRMFHVAFALHGSLFRNETSQKRLLSRLDRIYHPLMEQIAKKILVLTPNGYRFLCTTFSEYYCSKSLASNTVVATAPITCPMEEEDDDQNNIIMGPDSLNRF